VRAPLVEWQSDELAGHGSLRLVAPEALHMTLVFLGHLPEDAIPSVEEAALAGLESVPAASLSFGGVAPVPRGKPRLFALDVVDHDGGAAQVHGAVSRGLVAAGLSEPELREFWPHVTVARVASRRPERVTRRIEPPAIPGPFTADRVVLWRSQLGRDGPRYEPLAEARLGG
jgi:2'-5' RNA ligase